MILRPQSTLQLVLEKVIDANINWYLETKYEIDCCIRNVCLQDALNGVTGNTKPQNQSLESTAA